MLVGQITVAVVSVLIARVWRRHYIAKRLRVPITFNH